MGNTCLCSDGTVANCGERQLAICRVKDGKVTTTCVDLPGLGNAVTALLRVKPDFAQVAAARAHAFRVIAGNEAAAALTPIEQEDILRSGTVTWTDGSEVTFSLPAAIAFAVEPTPKNRQRKASR
ncbi:MAG: hypothetical protein ABSE46_13405 [Terracidiphilus sp.]